MAHNPQGGESTLSSPSSLAVSKAPSSKRRSEQRHLWQRGIQCPSHILVLNNWSIQTTPNLWEQQRRSQGRLPCISSTTCSQRPVASRAGARLRRLSPSEALWKTHGINSNFKGTQADSAVSVCHVLSVLSCSLKACEEVAAFPSPWHLAT